MKTATNLTQEEKELLLRKGKLWATLCGSERGMNDVKNSWCYACVAFVIDSRGYGSCPIEQECLFTTEFHNCRVCLLWLHPENRKKK